jgi:hypothetical protein
VLKLICLRITFSYYGKCVEVAELCRQKLTAGGDEFVCTLLKASPLLGELPHDHVIFLAPLI